ncbi:hypothetical protein BT93_C0881 [Corymbia citriodora subsp. variegata]|nr:hypothetical protein BT93_C0881 [Corymbia citriodora subsp. variegata]
MSTLGNTVKTGKRKTNSTKGWLTALTSHGSNADGNELISGAGCVGQPLGRFAMMTKATGSVVVGLSSGSQTAATRTCHGGLTVNEPARTETSWDRLGSDTSENSGSC